MDLMWAFARFVDTSTMSGPTTSSGEDLEDQETLKWLWVTTGEYLKLVLLSDLRYRLLRLWSGSGGG